MANIENQKLVVANPKVHWPLGGNIVGYDTLYSLCLSLSLSEWKTNFTLNEWNFTLI